MTEKIEKKQIDKWLIPKETYKREIWKGSPSQNEYSRFHKVFVYDDDSLRCSCVEWREKEQECTHMKFVRNKLKEMQYISRAEKGYKGAMLITDLPLREHEGIDLYEESFYIANSIPLREIDIDNEVILKLMVIGYERQRPLTRREAMISSRSGLPTYNDYRWSVKVFIRGKGDFIIHLDLIPYRKVKGRNTFVLFYTPTKRIEEQFKKILLEFKKWVQSGRQPDEKILKRMRSIKEERRKGILKTL